MHISSPFAITYTETTEEISVISWKAGKKLARIETSKDPLKKLLNEKIKTIFNIFYKSNDAFQLLLEVHSHSPIKVHFQSVKELLRNPDGSLVTGRISFDDENGSEIFINQEDKVEEQVDTLLFGLCNAKHRKQIQELEQLLIAGKIFSSEAYATRKAHLGFSTSLQHDHILKKSIKDSSWPSSMEEYVLGYKKNEWYEYLSNARASGHYGFYVKEYEEFTVDQQEHFQKNTVKQEETTVLKTKRKATESIFNSKARKLE